MRNVHVCNKFGRHNLKHSTLGGSMLRNSSHSTSLEFSADDIGDGVECFNNSSEGSRVEQICTGVLYEL